MMMAALMANSDYLILEALKQLIPLRNHLTYEQIAEACVVRCSERTVRRSVKRLEVQGHIIRYGKGRGKANGFKYRLSETG